MHATAVARSNIALSKYWGKVISASGAPDPGNFPAVPSLSVTLEGLATETTVTFDGSLLEDAFALDGVVQTGRPLARVVAMLERVRQAAGIRHRARVASVNDFPTASGLASSASGFAALALAASRAAGLGLAPDALADMARASSASAARSIFGGFVELDAGVGGGTRVVAEPTALDLRILVCVTSEAQKAVASTDGMAETSRLSPFYDAWLAEAPRIHARLRDAVRAGDLATVGALAERSALAMHASALAAGVVYVSGVTLDLVREVKALRDRGTGAWSTIDAGPHLKCLVAAEDAPAVKAHLASVPGVRRVLVARPGRGAELVNRTTAAAEVRA